ncbi:MAG: epoxyqueuosine reductase QueH [Lentisphaerae bacterium]|nr:epoxyqueuosine reductase QueH [Lentisphaerota bacterium]
MEPTPTGLDPTPARKNPPATRKQRLLLHICSALCPPEAIECLRADYEITGFFSNSNIAPEPEYWRRLTEAHRLATELGIPFIMDTYDHAEWLESVAGLESEPEGGARCERCFAFSLSHAAAYAAANGFDNYTTTLSIGPDKDSTTIFRVGREQGPFLEVNLKKKDGFRRSLELSRTYDLYREDYCGCEFSRSTPAPSA